MVRAALIAALVLGAPGSKKQWSKAHSVGVWFPKTWKVVERDKGSRAFVVDGPQLGPGVPRAVLWNAGPVGEDGLDAVAKKLAAKISGRPGFRITAQARKRIGPFPCVRFGVAIEDKRARGRFTLALLGSNYYLLELSAAASHYPAKTFDRIERSLEIPWRDHVVLGLALRAPGEWELADRNDARIFVGPLGSVLGLRRGDGAPPPGSGPKVTFLGKKRATAVEERKGIRSLEFEAEGWDVAVIMPVAVWDDLFPVYEKILADARIPKREE